MPLVSCSFIIIATTIVETGDKMMRLHHHHGFKAMVLLVIICHLVLGASVEMWRQDSLEQPVAPSASVLDSSIDDSEVSSSSEDDMVSMTVERRSSPYTTNTDDGPSDAGLASPSSKPPIDPPLEEGDGARTFHGWPSTTSWAGTAASPGPSR